MSDSKLHVFKFRVLGGNKGNTALIQKKLSDIGVEAPKIGEQIKIITKKYKGFRVSVLIIAKDKKYTVKVEDTPVSLLIDSIPQQKSENIDNQDDKTKKHLNITRLHGNISFDTIKQITHKLISQGKKIEPEKLAIDILGISHTMGLTIDNENPKVFIKKIKDNELKVDIDKEKEQVNETKPSEESK